MDDFKFNKQVATELYRKWFLLSKKNPSHSYDKEQIDDLVAIHKSQIGFLLKQLVEQALHAFRAEIPFLFINDKKFEEFDVEVLVIGNSIDCLSMPGCMVEAENRNAAFDNLLKAVIQCADARIRNGLWFLNRVFPMKLYDASVQSISSEELIQKLKEDGWNKEYTGAYHTILLKEGSKVTYTIANNSVISSGLHFGYNRLKFLMSGKQYYEMYQEVDDNGHWSCDICGGDSSTGCLYFDPTECPR